MAQPQQQLHLPPTARKQEMQPTTEKEKVIGASTAATVVTQQQDKFEALKACAKRLFVGNKQDLTQLNTQETQIETLTGHQKTCTQSLVQGQQLLASLKASAEDQHQKTGSLTAISKDIELCTLSLNKEATRIQLVSDDSQEVQAVASHSLDGAKELLELVAKTNTLMSRVQSQKKTMDVHLANALSDTLQTHINSIALTAKPPQLGEVPAAAQGPESEEADADDGEGDAMPPSEEELKQHQENSSCSSLHPDVLVQPLLTGREFLTTQMLPTQETDQLSAPVQKQLRHTVDVFSHLVAVGRRQEGPAPTTGTAAVHLTAVLRSLPFFLVEPSKEDLLLAAAAVSDTAAKMNLTCLDDELTPFKGVAHRTTEALSALDSLTAMAEHVEQAGEQISLVKGNSYTKEQAIASCNAECEQAELSLTRGIQQREDLLKELEQAQHTIAAREETAKHNVKEEEDIRKNHNEKTLEASQCTKEAEDIDQQIVVEDAAENSLGTLAAEVEALQQVADNDSALTTATERNTTSEGHLKRLEKYLGECHSSLAKILEVSSLNIDDVASDGENSNTDTNAVCGTGTGSQQPMIAAIREFLAASRHPADLSMELDSRQTKVIGDFLRRLQKDVDIHVECQENEVSASVHNNERRIKESANRIKQFEKDAAMGENSSSSQLCEHEAQELRQVLNLSHSEY